MAREVVQPITTTMVVLSPVANMLQSKMALKVKERAVRIVIRIKTKRPEALKQALIRKMHQTFSKNR